MASHTATPLTWTGLDQRAVDTARVLAMDAVQNVDQGRPGTAMNLAPAAHALFQGIATAVGMAMAARYERGLYDPEAPGGASVFDHMIWAIVSDGDLEEGVLEEASSLAGPQRVGNLVALRDDNHISIEVDTATAFSEDVPKRYEAYGRHVRRIAAQNTHQSYGAGLGAEEAAATKRVLRSRPELDFEVEQVLPPAVRALVAVEAGIAMGWRDLVGDAGRIVSLEHSGASADHRVPFEDFGITAEAVAEAARASLGAADH
ncbi:transketolase-like TK C-terminal-containing protein [Streptomyces sp. NPDC017520]|uniref:transketolase-like TK C-terminal-containing protein n=1 Tax=Streptomyces sp. NPDC017520 TaxID=3364998 RepID=UPI0037AA13EC